MGHCIYESHTSQFGQAVGENKAIQRVESTSQWQSPWDAQSPVPAATLTHFVSGFPTSPEASHKCSSAQSAKSLPGRIYTVQVPFFSGTALAQPPEEAWKFSQSYLGRCAVRQSCLSCQSSRGKCSAQFHAEVVRMALFPALLLQGPRQRSLCPRVTKLALKATPPASSLTAFCWRSTPTQGDWGGWERSRVFLPFSSFTIYHTHRCTQVHTILI